MYMLKLLSSAAVVCALLVSATPLDKSPQNRLAKRGTEHPDSVAQDEIDRYWLDCVDRAMKDLGKGWSDASIDCSSSAYVQYGFFPRKNVRQGWIAAQQAKGKGNGGGGGGGKPSSNEYKSESRSKGWLSSGFEAVRNSEIYKAVRQGNPWGQEDRPDTTNNARPPRHRPPYYAKPNMLFGAKFGRRPL